MTRVVYRNTISMVFDQPLDWEDYQKMDIYVRADRSGSPWGRDIIEAMWAGLPIVATGSNEEFIINKETGFLVEQGNPSAIAKYVTQLLRDDDLYNKIASASATRARFLFDKRKYIERLSNLFNK